MRQILRNSLLIIMIFSGAGMAQSWTQVEANPETPVKQGFDTDRAIFWAEPNFIPLRDPEWVSLNQAFQNKLIKDDTPVLLLEAGGEKLLLVTAQMSYHHVAQGTMNGEPWMVTF